MNQRNVLLGGASLMFLGIALGAFGAHALRDILTPESRAIYETAVFYHLIHAIALLCLASGDIFRRIPPQLFTLSAWCFLFGTVAFSGSLYVLAVTQIALVGIITPIGGVAFLVGWISLAVASRKISTGEVR